MKVLLFIFLFMTIPTLAKTEAQKPADKKSEDKKQDNVYSFKPLLIKGRLKKIKKSKEVQHQGGSILESEVFFIKPELRSRIFLIFGDDEEEDDTSSKK